MPKREEPHRTVYWPQTRARQCALAAQYLNLHSTEDLIQLSIANMLMLLANNDSSFAAMLSQVG